MKKSFRYLGLLLGVVVLLGWEATTHAQEIKVTTSVDKNIIKMDEKLKLTLTIHGTQEAPQPSFPAIDGFNLLYGPQILAQTQIVNGNVTVSKGFTYVLQPTSKGTFTIGPSKLKYKGRTYSSDPIQVKVVDATPAAQSESFDLEKLIFVELSTDITEAYLYQQVVLSFKLYFQKGMPLTDINYAAPATKNFMTEKMGDQLQYEEIKNGIIYNVLELRKAIFPIIPGELKVSPARLNCNLLIKERRQRRGSSFDDLFDDFFGGSQRKYTVERETNPITLKVKPLPEEGKPEEFNGSVGSFDMRVEAKTTEVNVGDPITLSISVYGEGNINTITEPVLKIQDEDDFKLYPAESNTQITHREKVIRGRKVFTKVIEPQKAELKQIPAVIFCFFDPVEEHYKTIKHDPVPISVKSWAQEAPIQLTASLQENANQEKQEVQLLTQDIFPIMTKVTSLRNQGKQIYKHPFIMACLFIPAVVLISTFYLVRHRERLQTDVGYARNKKARSEAQKGLAAAQASLSPETSSEFYSYLSKVLSDYLADKLNISAASVSDDKVAGLLKREGVSDDIIEKISYCLTSFEYHRFSKDGGTRAKMEDSLTKVRHLITSLEKKL